MTQIATILDFAAAPHDLPDAVRADAVRLLADTLACGAAGAVSPDAKRVVDSSARTSADQTARLLSGGSAAEGAAAFCNGFAIHCLEWDAVHEPAVVHALSVVTAALLAASDRRGGSNPDDFLTALAVGVDVACGLGVSATGPLRFFRPATAGVIGAALGVARLHGLTRTHMADVAGLAYSFASGTMQAHIEGSVALPLQIAQAAQAAVQAVNLVKAGLGGPHDVLEGPFGYNALIEPIDLARYTATIGQIWRLSEISIKPFPSGRASHAVLGTLAQIRESGRTIKAMTAYVPPLINRLVGRPYHGDMTPAYARLCLPFLGALMLRDGRIDPRRFKPAVFADADLAKLAALMTIKVDGNADSNALSPQRLVVDYADGTRADLAIPITLGSPDAPLTPVQAAQKYELCRVLAGDCDPRIFDDPLAYVTEPK